jgi:hypothetical protein
LFEIAGEKDQKSYFIKHRSCYLKCTEEFQIHFKIFLRPEPGPYKKWRCFAISFGIL